MMGGFCVGIAHYPRWTCLIRPFWDRLDIQMPYVFYECDPVNVALPYSTVFTPRFWEEREHWYNTGVGIVPGTTRVLQTIPDIPPNNALVATPDQLLNGFSYDDYVNGRLPVSECIAIRTICDTIGEATPTNLWVDSTGWVDYLGVQLSLFNGCVKLHKVAPCGWESFDILDEFGAPFGKLVVTVDALRVRLTFLINSPLGGYEFRLVTAWDGRAALSLPYFDSPEGFPVYQSSMPLSIRPCGVQEVIPTGMLQSYVGSTPPSGWVFCDGRDYPTSSPYANLYNLIGNDYDTSRGQAAPGPGRFRVPLLSGLVIGTSGPAVAAAGPAPATLMNPSGGFAGQEAAAIVLSQIPAHSHAVIDAGHSHSLSDPGHTHGVTDPGHAHTAAGGNRFVTEDAFGAESDTGAPSGLTRTDATATSATGLTVSSASTGATVDTGVTGVAISNTGSGDAIDRKQPTVYYPVCIKL